MRVSAYGSSEDPSNGYESVAAEFIRRREASAIGVRTVLDWAACLPGAGAVLDLGCGSGKPVSAALRDVGFQMYGVDASPRLIQAYRLELPTAQATCESVETSNFFGRTFDGVLAVGLIFLLPADAQLRLISKVAEVLKPGARFLFSSPVEACSWADVLTGRRSLSLGAEAYRQALAAAGLTQVNEYLDEGANHYFEACRLPLRSSLP